MTLAALLAQAVLVALGAVFILTCAVFILACLWLLATAYLAAPDSRGAR